MLLALLSALLTALLWLGIFLALFGGLGYLIGQKYQKLVPQKQDHLPPHLLFWAPFLIGLAIGAMDGIHVAAPQAALAGGDSYLRQALVIKTPFTNLTKTVKTNDSTSWSASWRQVNKDITPTKLALALAVKAVLGPALGPILSLKILVEAHQSGSSSWDKAWWKARPKLELLSKVTVLASLALGSLYLILMAIGFLILIFSARRDLPPPLPRPQKKP